MKKILLLIWLSFLIPLTVQAVGTFQLLNFSALPSGVSGQPYEATINFVYSGDWVPSSSLVGSTLPKGLINEFYTGTNGIGWVKIKGTPTDAGNFNINILLTDNNGATLLKNVNLLIENGSQHFSVKSYLPIGYIGQDYKGTITVNYFGQVKPNIYYSGIPNGIFVDSNDYPSNGKGELQLTLAGKPSRLGNYPISFKVWDETQNEVKQFQIIISDPPASNTVKNEPVITPLTETPVSKASPVKVIMQAPPSSKKISAQDILPVKIEEKAPIEKNNMVSTSLVEATSSVAVLEEKQPTMVVATSEAKVTFFGKIRLSIKSMLFNLANKF